MCRFASQILLRLLDRLLEVSQSVIESLYFRFQLDHALHGVPDGLLSLDSGEALCGGRVCAALI